jgi:spermidine/putrescine transport system ATP-binding protein
MRIEPRQVESLNVFDVKVKSILFDGANSRLLTMTKEDHELIVTLPQNRKFDYIQPGDDISVGWHPESGICFEAEG